MSQAAILFVDDDANILAAMQRQLHRRFEIHTAQGATDGLRAVGETGPYAVVISDLRMPGMDGIEFLRRVKDLNPDTVRIMLTGHADLHNAIDAVNEGHIFRFLTKPCPPDVLEKTLTAGAEQYRLIQSERDLLELTLKGSVRALSDVLAMVNPTAFGRAARIHRMTRLIAKRLGVTQLWETETAALLSHVGCVTVPEPVLLKMFRCEKLPPDEARMLQNHPLIGHDLIVNIPRMGGVADIIAYQQKQFDGQGIPADERCGDAIPVGARILKAVTDHDALVSQQISPRQALAELKTRDGWYDPQVLVALEDAIIQQEAGSRYLLKVIGVKELELNMIMADDVWSSRGMLLVSKGQDVNVPLILRLRNYAGNAAIREPIKVLVPVSKTAGAEV